jgi:hypothetical protein
MRANPVRALFQIAPGSHPTLELISYNINTDKGAAASRVLVHFVAKAVQ